jgi:putative ABC transport system permease protein
MRAVLSLGWAAVRRHRVQSVIIAAVVLLSSATAVLGLGLLVASDAPFEQAFQRQHGAHAAAAFPPGVAVASTATRPGVTAAAGPFGTFTAGPSIEGRALTPSGLIVARPDPGGAVDRLAVSHGHWLTGPGQIVLSSDVPGYGRAWHLGDRVTLDLPSRPTLVVVGVAGSATRTASAWVWPGQFTATGQQMLYRFASAGSEAAVRAGLATATAGLPLTGSTSYLAVKLSISANLKAIVPFVVAFALLGLAISVLIIGNVVAGAVVAGFRAIGVQKTLGFTPAQVVLVHTGQILTVAVPAGVAGTALGYAVSFPILSQTAEAYGLPGSTSVPLWAGLVVLFGLPLIVGAVAVATAARAGRLPAVQAITVGRAPPAGRGFRVRRALAASRLPQPVAFGIGTPFARPARSAVTVLAVLLGSATLVFAIGLATSLARVVADFDRSAAAPVQVSIGPGPGGPGGPPGSIGAGPDVPVGSDGSGGSRTDVTAARKTIAATTGTAHVVGMIPVDGSLAGSSAQIQINAYDGDATWTGYPMLSGRWYQTPAEAVVSSRMLHLTGTRVGDFITVTTQQGSRRLHIVGEAFTNGSGSTLIMDAAGLPDPGAPIVFEVALTPGTGTDAYVQRLNDALGETAVAESTTAAQDHESIRVALALIGTLSLLLCAVTALGVLHTVVLDTRERAHEIGVLKAIGQTPRQVRVTVVSSMVAIGLAGGVLAVPLGVLLHRVIIRAIAQAAGTGMPHEVTAAYGIPELIGLGAAGIVLAVIGALIPAGWAARSSVAAALRAE